MPSFTDGPPPTPLVPDPVRARAARLEARLAVYAQYAAVVAEQAAATVAGDEARLAALIAQRDRAAEHFAELRAPVGHLEEASFRDALDEALTELAHQGAVDMALGQRMVALREAVLRGAAWVSESEGAPSPARPARPALAAPAGAPAAGETRPAGDGAAADDTSAPRAAPTDVAEATAAALPGLGPAGAPLEGAQVAARAAHVGGVLDGRFPGRGTRDAWPTGWPAGRSAGDGASVQPPRSDVPRLDVRF